ncbi:SEC-C metal-binding domain-containing protein [Lacipirellula sp.]|uniref:SEC-C metal-binding domain-containing protein n=1 Tax=Lacipirellula sp. TaxID=2691419 RepID=UPI003D0AE8A7
MGIEISGNTVDTAAMRRQLQLYYGSPKFAEELAKRLMQEPKRTPPRYTAKKLLGLHRKLKLAKDVRPGRNAPCPCGSGRKFKVCCGVLP